MAIESSNRHEHKGFPILTHLNMLAVALAVAIVAWFFARSEQITEAGVMIPIKLRMADTRMEVRLSTDAVRGWVTYPVAIQGSVNSDNLLFDINADGMFPDLTVEWQKKTMSLDESHLVANVPQANEVRLRVQDRNPLRVDVEARWKAWQADAVPTVSGEAALAERGLALQNPPRLTPRQVWIAGAQDKLEQLKRDPVTQRLQVPTDPIILSDFDRPILKTVGFDLPPGLEIVQPKSGTTELSLDIQEITTERDIASIPLTKAMFAGETVDADIVTSFVTVKLRGPQGLLKRLDTTSVHIMPIRPAQELPDTEREVKLEAALSSDLTAEFGTRVTIISVDPATVTVTYRKKR